MANSLLSTHETDAKHTQNRIRRLPYAAPMHTNRHFLGSEAANFPLPLAAPCGAVPMHTHKVHFVECIVFGFVCCLLLLRQVNMRCNKLHINIDASAHAEFSWIFGIQAITCEWTEVVSFAKYEIQESKREPRIIDRSSCYWNILCVHWLWQRWHHQQHRPSSTIQRMVRMGLSTLTILAQRPITPTPTLWMQMAIAWAALGLKRHVMHYPVQPVKWLCIWPKKWSIVQPAIVK